MARQDITIKRPNKNVKNMPEFREFAGAQAPTLPAMAVPSMRTEVYLVLLAIVGLVAAVVIGESLLTTFEHTITPASATPGQVTTFSGNGTLQPAASAQSLQPTGAGSGLQPQSSAPMQSTVTTSALQGGTQ
jgi:hypothetical protein